MSKNFQNFLSQDTTKPGSSAYTRKDDYRHPPELLTTRHSYYDDPPDIGSFNHFNTAIPDNTFGPDEERIFIDDDPFDTEETVFQIESKETSHLTTHLVVPTVTMMNTETGHTTRHHHGSTEGHHRRAHSGKYNLVTQSNENTSSNY